MVNVVPSKYIHLQLFCAILKIEYRNSISYPTRIHELNQSYNLFSFHARIELGHIVHRPSREGSHGENDCIQLRNGTLGRGTNERTQFGYRRTLLVRFRQWQVCPTRKWLPPDENPLRFLLRSIPAGKVHSESSNLLSVSDCIFLYS